MAFVPTKKARCRRCDANGRQNGRYPRDYAHDGLPHARHVRGLHPFRLSEESKRTDAATSKVKEASAVQLARRTTFSTSLLTEKVAVLLYAVSLIYSASMPPLQLING
jgi:hypothetical protein